LDSEIYLDNDYICADVVLSFHESVSMEGGSGVEYWELTPCVEWMAF